MLETTSSKHSMLSGQRAREAWNGEMKAINVHSPCPQWKWEELGRVQHDNGRIFLPKFKFVAAMVSEIIYQYSFANELEFGNTWSGLLSQILSHNIIVCVCVCVYFCVYVLTSSCRDLWNKYTVEPLLWTSELGHLWHREVYKTSSEIRKAL